MSTFMEVCSSLDLTTLEDLDFPIPCGHSLHNRPPGEDSHHDDGPATHLIQVFHDCPVDPCKGLIYPGCSAWAAYVSSRYDAIWLCNHCRVTSYGANFVVVLGPIK